MIDAREMATKLILNAAYYSGASTLASSLMSGNGSILMLHRVTDTDCSPLGMNRNLSVTPDFLDQVLTDLKRRGTALISLDELLATVRKSQPCNAVTITADDAYLDNYLEALPVFEAHDAPFTIYVAPGLTSGDVLPWWEVLEDLAWRFDTLYLPTDGEPTPVPAADIAQKCDAYDVLRVHLTEVVAEEDQQRVLRQMVELAGGTLDAGPRRFMNWDELRRLASHRLATLGAHTVNHFNVRRLPAELALQEMMTSADIIEAETGRRPRHFAFPYGSSKAAGARDVKLARQAGFKSAVTTRHGILQPGHVHHLHALPRISVNGRYQQLRYVRTLLSGVTTPIANGGRRLVTI